MCVCVSVCVLSYLLYIDCILLTYTCVNYYLVIKRLFVCSGVQLTNPFYSIWATKSGRSLGVSYKCLVILVVVVAAAAAVIIIVMKDSVYGCFIIAQ